MLCLHSRLYTLATAGDGITGQLCAAAFQQDGNFNSKNLGTLVQECKRQIHRAGFVLAVDFLRDVSLFCHVLLAVAQDFTHAPDTVSDIHQLIGRILITHNDNSFSET